MASQAIATLRPGEALPADAAQAGYPDGLHRLAVAAAVVTFLLLAVGGIVTSREAGMIFSDWPLSNGSVNPEGWLTNADKMSEHGHRLLGSLVGLLTIWLAVWLQRRDERRSVKVLGWVALAAVIAQGLLGGLRVTENSTSLAMIHGCTGQAYFMVMVALAYLTSTDSRAVPEPGRDAGGLLYASMGVILVLYMQIVHGARLRHVGGPLDSHFFGALLVAGSAIWMMAIVLLGHGGRTALRRPAFLITALLLLQIGLGFYTAYVLVRSYDGYEPPLETLLLPSLHQAVGALLLAVAVWLALKAHRRSGPRAAEVSA